MLIDEMQFVLTLQRYQDFTILEDPVPFCELFHNQNIEYVQLHDITIVKKLNDVVGFSGCFIWKDNEIRPEDGDAYYEDMLVYGYHYFEYDGVKCLDILVLNW